MVGLTWGDTQVNLEIVQYGAILMNTAFWLSRKASLVLVFLCTVLMFWIFWNDSAALDTDWLFRQGQKYQTATWQRFTGVMPKKVYIQYQTPFYPFFVSRNPVLWVQQLFIMPLVVGNGVMILQLFGNAGRFLLATPLYFVMSTQPSTDILVFSCVVMALRAYQLGFMAFSSLLYGLSWLAKPLTITVLPGMVLYLKWWILVSLAIWGTYILISLQYGFGQKQWNFIQHQVLLKPFSSKNSGQGWQRNSFRWRFRTITKPTIPAFFVWLFPAYTRRILLVGFIIGIGILLGYGNIKYFLLWSLFLFPVQKVTYA